MCTTTPAAGSGVPGSDPEVPQGVEATGVGDGRDSSRPPPSPPSTTPAERPEPADSTATPRDLAPPLSTSSRGVRPTSRRRQTPRVGDRRGVDPTRGGRVDRRGCRARRSCGMRCTPRFFCRTSGAPSRARKGAPPRANARCLSRASCAHIAAPPQAAKWGSAREVGSAPLLHRGRRPEAGRVGRAQPVHGVPRRGARPSPPARSVAAVGGVDGGFGAAGEAEFVQHRGDVVLDGLFRQVHLGADLAVGEAVGDVVEDALLLWGQRAVAGVVGLGAGAQACSTVAVALGSSSDPPAATVRTAPTRSTPATCLSR